jgi:hypothetical protein
VNAKTWIPLIAAALLTLNCSAAFAQGKGHGKGHDQDKHGDDSYTYSSE